MTGTGGTPTEPPTRRLVGALVGALPEHGASDLRLVLPVAVMWVAAAVLVGMPDTAWWVVGVSAVLAVAGGGVVWMVTRSTGVRGVGLLAVAVLAVGLVALVAVAVGVGERNRSPTVLAALSAHERVTATVRVSRDVAPSDRSFLGTLTGVRTSRWTSERLDVPVRVVATGDRLAAGSTVSVTGQIQPEPPGGTVASVLFARADPEPMAPPSGFTAMTHRARAAFAATVEDLPQPGAGLLRGLAIGDRSAIDDATTAAMETTALTHLTAVSGSNCAVLVGLVVLGGRAVSMPRTVRAVAAVVTLSGFVALVGPDPSIVRAAIMATVVLVVDVVGRPVRATSLIAVATLSMLVWDPWYARSFAFVLSVLATAGIVVVAPPLTRLLARRMWTPLAALVAVPIAAQTACWPVTVLLAPTIPTYAVPANLLAEPLAPIGTVVGLLACVVAPVWPTGASVVAAVAWVPATAIAVTARWLATMPFASVPWPGGVAGVVDATLLCSGIIVAVLLRRRPLRAAVAAGATVVAVVGVGVVVIPAAVVRASLPSEWGIAACDVGQGDAVLVRDSGSVLLVDTGDDEERLLACLDLLGVDRIDVLVASHFDRDHIGAVAAVADRVDIALVGPEGRPEDAAVVRTLQMGGADVRRASVGTAGTLGRLAWQVLWPLATTRTGGNDASVVLAVRPAGGCTECLSSLFLGDLGERAQRRLVGAVAPEDIGPVDVVKVAHHGSADQDAGLYRLARAGVGIVSVGADNTYGHPTASALEMLAAAGTAVVRTDLGGTAVLSRSDGGGGGGDGGGDAGGADGDTDAVLVWQEHPDAQGASALARTLVPGVDRRDVGSGAHGDRSVPGTERNRWPSRRRRALRRRSTRCRGPASDRPP